MALLPERYKFLVAIVTTLCCAMTMTAGFNLAVMSIDLGSEFMKIAIVKPGVPMEIVLNDESSRKTSTIVAMRDGERYFGNMAESTAVKFPRKAFWYLTHLLGKKYDDPQVQKYIKRFPYYTIEEDEARGTPLFKSEDGDLYSPEELLAMVLEKAKAHAESFADQPINDCVITVPVFYTQAERKAVLQAANMVGLNVLQLISDNAAVALNYGVFRRKNFNSTIQYYMFYDMGATSTTATIVGYQVVKQKEGTRVESNPQLVIKGVGFDKGLGGLEMTLRLRQHLAKLFNDQKKTKTDVFKNDRAMGKLFKEAGRVKKVLSANNDHFAQVEGLLDDKDFHAKVTREEFEKMCEDLFTRVTKPIEDALKISQITLPEIKDVILMGGGTRVPKIQEILTKFIGRKELGKSINTDEAAALGAVYQAAHLGKGFKVKKFGIKEANIYPIVVEFEKHRLNDDGTDSYRTVRRTLFNRMNPFPQKKVMTFNKHYADFSFNTSYGDLDFLTAQDAKSFEMPVLNTYSLSGVEDAYGKHRETAEPKGIKAHFRLDESGILHLDKVESVFEKQEEEKKEEESTWSKIGSTFGGLFGSKEEKKEETKEEDQTEPPTEGDKSSSTDKKGDGEQKKPDQAGSEDEQKPDQTGSEQTSESKSEEKTKQSKIPAEEETPKTEKEQSKDEKKEDKKEEQKTEGEKNATKEEEKKDDKPKIVVIKEEIKSESVNYDVPDYNKDQVKASKKKLADLTAKDKEKVLLEKAKNDLESFIFDMKDKIYQEEYEKCSTEDERSTISKNLEEASDWMYDQADDAKKEVYIDKLKSLKDGVKDLEYRVKQLQDRPKALDALKSMLNHTDFFLKTLKNLSSTGESVFTDVEITTLEKLINDTYKWRNDMLKEQEKTPLTEKPKLLLEDIGLKYQALDREVNYLINKAKNFKPKPPKTSAKKNTTKTKDNNETRIPDPDSEKEAVNKTPTEDQTESTTTKDGIEIELPAPPTTKQGKRKPKSKRETTPAEEEILQLDSGDTNTDSSDNSNIDDTKSQSTSDSKTDDSSSKQDKKQDSSTHDPQDL